MALRTRTGLFLCMLLLGSFISRASHIFGGDLLYTHITGNTYRVALTLYGDCGAPLSGTLDSVRPNVYVYNGNSFIRTLSLHLEQPGIEISPVCPSMLHRTTCNSPSGTLPGIKQYIYVDTTELPYPSANWQFVFTGNLPPTQFAGRSQNITNVQFAGNTKMYLTARLDNTSGPNSSPQYTTIPTPYYCSNLSQQYNQGAVDEDGDSLAFTLVPAMNGTGSSNIFANPATYYSGLSGTYPLTVIPGTFSFSALNGQLTFTPQGMQNSLIVTQVSEYRHGVLTGTSQREMTFVVTDDSEGTPPSLFITALAGGAATAGNVVNVCVGTPHVSFDIRTENPENDKTEVIPRNVPTSATLSISGNNSPAPAMHFEWDTDTLAVGAYTFFLEVKNEHCPLSGRQTIAYTINIVPFPVVTAASVAPTNCIHQALVQYDFKRGYIPRLLEIYDTAGTLQKTLTDTTGTVTDSLPAGDYTLRVSSQAQCATSTQFSITDGGILPLQPITQEYCTGDTVLPIPVTLSGPGARITWFDTALNILPHMPVPSTAAPTTYQWYMQEWYKVCTSEKVAVNVYVHPLPDITITPPPASVCLGDTVYLQASGGATYYWHSQQPVLYTTDSIAYTRAMRIGDYHVRVTTRHGCTDSATVIVPAPQQCCQYSYPTAFTPNRDGINDGFKVITYGNSRSYRLAVYNRWGQMVFLTYDPALHWDGTWNGTPCEMGTYYYIFSGQCLTGYTEEHKGDVTLIR